MASANENADSEDTSMLAGILSEIAEACAECCRGSETACDEMPGVANETGSGKT